LIEENDSAVLMHYCKIYMMEIRSKQKKYSLLKYSKDTGYSYVTLRRLQKIAKEILKKNK